MANKTSSKKGQGTAPKKLGRPSKYDDELADVILAMIAEGNSLTSITKSPDMPSTVTVYSWLRHNEDFLNRYTRAKEEQADTLADQLLDIANGTLSGRYDPNAARVAMDGYKWSAMKLKPKKYGDKLDMTSDGKALPQPILAMLTTQATDNNTKRDVIDGEIVPDGQNKKTLPGAEYDAPVQNLPEVEEKTSQNIMDDINGA